MVEFAEHLNFKGIGFKSAGDHPRRAPTSVRISVFHALNGGWNEIAFRPLAFGLQKWNMITFPEIHGSTKSVKFDFVNEHKVDGIQLGEIVFFHLGEVSVQPGIQPQIVVQNPVQQTVVAAQIQPTVIVEPQPIIQ